MPALVSALKRVDLPTLGKPTMPHWRLMGRLSDSIGGAGGRRMMRALPQTPYCNRPRPRPPQKPAAVLSDRQDPRQVRPRHKRREIVAQALACADGGLPGGDAAVVVEAVKRKILAVWQLGAGQRLQKGARGRDDQHVVEPGAAGPARGAAPGHGLVQPARHDVLAEE